MTYLVSKKFIMSSLCDMITIFEKMQKSTILIFTIIVLVHQSQSLRLTNMTAPALQDPRKDMKLHCSFDMGDEKLYAVKWYKDDHEFFRYSPSTTQNSLLQFPVNGVYVQSEKTKCHHNGCDLLLTNLTRPFSSGAYRCEVSSEAPAFRLASQTHNVTVAAIPDVPPTIEGLNENYLIGDIINATCKSGYGDPKPLLNWYINKNQITSSKNVKEISQYSSASSSSLYYDNYHQYYHQQLQQHQQHERIQLEMTTVQLKFPIDKKLTQNRPRLTIEISCQSIIDGINPVVAPPLITTKFIIIEDQNQLVSNQKYASIHSSSSSTALLSSLTTIIIIKLSLFSFIIMFNC